MSSPAQARMTLFRRRMMEEENGLFACELDVLLGYDHWSEVPDDGSEEPEVAMPRAVGDCGIGFNLGGPGNLRRMEKITVESSDGFDMDVDRLYTWAPAPDQVGHSVAEVGDRVSFIFRNSKSWMAAGIALRRVPFEEAQWMVEGTFGNHKGLMHELAHAFGQGRHNTRPQACPSVMGGPPGIWPTPSDISSTRRWAHP
jgi:hypothetical protein